MSRNKIHYKELASSVGGEDDSPGIKVYKKRWYILMINSFYAIVAEATWNTWSPIAHPAEVYKRRWYMLLVNSFYSCVQAAVWNTWSPIAHPAEVVFGWTDATIALFVNYGCIVMAVCMMFFSWLIVNKGFRIALVVNAFLCALGAAVRCLPLNNFWFTVSCHVGAIINGASVLAQSSPAILSAIWFPPNERTTATAVGSAANFLGTALSFVIGPQIVHDLHAVNSTVINNSFTAHISPSPLNPSYDVSDIKRTRSEIMTLMYIYAGAATAIFLAILAYFPAKPPLPPCASAATERVDYIRGLRKLFSKVGFWEAVVSSSAIMGVYSSWSSLIDVNLHGVGVSQSHAGWIGFSCIIAACIGGFMCARVNDICQRHMKVFLLVLIVVAAVMTLWFALMTQKLLEPDLVQFYVSAILASLTLGGTLPLYYELCCETAYPTHEAVATGVQSVLCNVASAVFYLIFLAPNIGTSWMNWAQLGVLILCIPLILLHKETYSRLDIDDINLPPDAVDDISVPDPDVSRTVNS